MMGIGAIKPFNVGPTLSVKPNIETLCMIADYFNTSIDYLVGHTNIKRRYEQVNESHLNSDEQIIVDCYRRLSKKDKDILAVLINRLTQKQ